MVESAVRGGVRISEQNVELTLRITDPFNRRDVDAALALWDEEGAWYPAIEAVTEGGRTYRGHAEMRQYYRDLAEFAEESVVEWSKVYDLGDRVLCLGRGSIRFSSGVEFLDQKVGCLFTWRDGKLLEARPYRSHAGALEAAGLRENAD
jgi:ketosteroid isomerase-like protein